MSRPKLISKMHPDYPRGRTENTQPVPTYYPVSYEALQAFYDAHPEFADEGHYEYQCGSCGFEIDEDHDYCSDCDQRGGEWVLIDKDGEVVE